MANEFLQIVHCGDRALLVYLGDQIDPEVNARVHALAMALKQKGHPAVVEVTPSYHAILIEYDPVRIRPDQVEAVVASAASAGSAQVQTAQTVEIPVLYGGEAGPDLEAVAAHAGLSASEVVQRHSTPLYRVYCLGFSPGFSYLGGLDSAIHTPRLAEPRIKVPGGSVGIGGAQTGIYPAPSPGGWQLIGRTPLRLFEPHRDPPALLDPGDNIRFVPITPERFAELEAENARAVSHPAEYAEGKTGLRILQPGLATTVQDLGRRGYMAYGVPVAGAADYRSLMIGNWLLGNRARAGALEITMVGPEIEFTGPSAFCLTGAPVPAELIPADGGQPRPVPGWTALLASPGDRLRIGTMEQGCRSYLCIAGGCDLPPLLGSVSEDLFGKIGPFGRPLKAGDWLPTGLPLHPPAALAGRFLPADLIPVYSDEATIRVTRGPQADAFSSESYQGFLAGEYTVGAQSDRQGLRLQGPRIAHAAGADILSEPVPPGSVQVPANGQPILLMANRQTTGGYTKIAVAVYPDLAFAAQLRPGARLRFAEVTQAEAHAIAWAERRKLAQIRRYLERYAGPQAVFDTPAPPPDPAAAGQPQIRPQETGAAQGERTFRITVGEVTFEATVEEVKE